MSEFFHSLPDFTTNQTVVAVTAIIGITVVAVVWLRN